MNRRTLLKNGGIAVGATIPCFAAGTNGKSISGKWDECRTLARDLCLGDFESMRRFIGDFVFKDDIDKGVSVVMDILRTVECVGIRGFAVGEVRTDYWAESGLFSVNFKSKSDDKFVGVLQVEYDSSEGEHRQITQINTFTADLSFARSNNFYTKSATVDFFG